MPIKPLDRRGIIEAIRGPARPGRLFDAYRLEVEEDLPEVIADDLLADAGSALAPTLQVLLTNMWKRAREANPGGPRFDRPLYESMKSRGYLLRDVLDDGLKAIEAWRPEVAESGLPLDLLAFHTTDLATAAQHPRDVVEARYAHRADVLDGLIARCKDHYLLIEAEAGPDGPVVLAGHPAGPRPAGPAGPAPVPDLGRPRPARPPAAGEPRPGVGGRQGRDTSWTASTCDRRGRCLGDAGLDRGRSAAWSRPAAPRSRHDAGWLVTS